MKTILLLTLLAAGTALADPALLIYPQPDGAAINGAPGQAVGWGFKLTGDSSNWVSITGSLLLFETNPGIGFYNDLIGLQGGPTGGALAPNATWQQGYDAWKREGLGEFVIDALAMPGDSNGGGLLVLYELFSADPNVCGSACLNGSGSILVPFNVNVTAAPAVPEPGTGLLFALAAATGGGLLLLNRTKVRR